MMRPQLLILLALLVVIALALMTVAAAYANTRRQRAKKRRADPTAAMSDAGVRELIAAGERKRAIRAYRDFTGVDQFTAAEAIARIERDMHREAHEREAQAAALERLRQGDRLAAVEAYQRATGATDAEAQAMVDRLERLQRGEDGPADTWRGR